MNLREEAKAKSRTFSASKTQVRVPSARLASLASASSGVTMKIGSRADSALISAPSTNTVAPSMAPRSVSLAWRERGWSNGQLTTSTFLALRSTARAQSGTPARRTNTM